jgi:hypothetical protein
MANRLDLRAELSSDAFPLENAILRASYWIKALKPLKEHSFFSDNCEWVDDALPRLRDGKILSLAPGETRRLWMTISNKGVPAGTYKLKLSLRDASGATEVIPIQFNVADTVLAPDPNLNVYTYAYLTRKSSRDFRKEALEDLKRHYQNTYVVPLLPKYNPRTEDIDFSGIIEYLKPLGDARRILFFWNCETGKVPFCPAKGWGSEKWRNTLRRVISRWYSALKSAGFGKEKVVMYPFDETYDNKCCGGRSEYQALADVADELHAIDPLIKVFMDPVGFNEEDMRSMRVLADKIDVWAPVQELYHDGGKKGWPHPYSLQEKLTARRFFQNLKSKGKTIWSYQCSGPNKTLDVNGYFRQYPWRAWCHGITGLGIWSYNNIRGKSSWSDEDGGDFTFVYEMRDAPDDIPRKPFEPLIPSRRWQAYRAGIQDYLLLSMAARKGVSRKKLRAIAGKVLKNSLNSNVIEQAHNDLINLIIGKGGSGK